MTDSSRLPRAVLSRGENGNWRVFVALLGADPWPTAELATEIPTPEARATALRELGYEIPPEAAWEWQEDRAPDGAVLLLAGLEVRPIESPSRTRA